MWHDQASVGGKGETLEGGFKIALDALEDRRYRE